MKIHEITEGYVRGRNGEPDHTDEAFPQVWSTIKKGAQVAKNATGAIVGATGRQIGDIKNTAISPWSGKAQGAKEMQRVVGGVIKNFNRYLGQTNSKPTVGALKQYLTALGFQDPDLTEVAKGAMAGRARQGFDPSKRGAQQPKAQAPAQQAPATGGRKDTDVLTRNDLFDIIGKNIQQAMKTGTLPKELKKVLGQ